MTAIEWTHRPGTKGEVWNPVTGCDKVSQGCKNCYAEKMHKRLNAMGIDKYQNKFLGDVRVHEDTLRIPFAWRTPRTVFVNSMSDLFHKDVPYWFIDLVFAAMAIASNHTFIIVTKRPERAAEWFRHKDMSWKDPGMRGPERIRYQTYHHFGSEVTPDRWIWPLPNVWLLTSIEDQDTANLRVPYLVQCEAAVLGVSAEPLLGRIDFEAIPMPRVEKVIDGKSLGLKKIHYIDWIITGGESGPKSRPVHPDWIESIKDQAQEAKIPFFFKQWGHYRPFVESAQAPFWTDCDTGNEHDGHGMNFIDYDHKTESGRFMGYRWYPHMDAIVECVEEGERLVSFLSMGKHNSGSSLYGKQYLQFPM